MLREITFGIVPQSLHTPTKMASRSGRGGMGNKRKPGNESVTIVFGLFIPYHLGREGLVTLQNSNDMN